MCNLYNDTWNGSVIVQELCVRLLAARRTVLKINGG